MTRTRVSSLRSAGSQRWLLAAVIVLLPATECWAGHLLQQQAVGGISIDVEGVVGPPNDSARKKLLAALRKEIKEPSDELMMPVELRMVSLRGLAEACEHALRNNFGQLPDEVRFLAGIQRIQYVFLYPEENDIVLAGPGEGWTVDEQANVVGITTGRPVLQLDDFLVALRYAQQARTDGISCSIDPTAEGNKALAAVLERQRGRPRLDPPLLKAEMKQAFGPQLVTISGVPQTSHFARVLVAADYRMKRLAMKLEESPVRGLPSYLDLIGATRQPANVNPRWWLACNYEPLAASEDGLAWELRGPGVRVMTEDGFFAETGEVRGTGRTSAPAQRWADLMTDQYDALAAETAVFGELRNLMDMCVVAALLEKERLYERAGLSVSILAERDSPLKLQTWNAAKTIAPEVSFLRSRRSWIVTASGGVQVESWQVASRSERVPAMEAARRRAAPGSRRSLWWQ